MRDISLITTGAIIVTASLLGIGLLNPKLIDSDLRFKISIINILLCVLNVYSSYKYKKDLLKRFN